MVQVASCQKCKVDDLKMDFGMCALDVLGGKPRMHFVVINCRLRVNHARRFLKPLNEQSVNTR